MNTQQAYNQWAEQYDTNHNRTRDLEAVALKALLNGFRFRRALEIGCGTGKNTEWLRQVSDEVNAVDFSGEMLAMARKKIPERNVRFVQADIAGAWDFVWEAVDLITFSLVLEHVEDLRPVFEKASRALQTGGHLYLGELHPFKQYGGTKARFEGPDGTTVLTSFNHHFSDFTNCMAGTGLKLERVEEFFDDQDRSSVPRILALLFCKQ